MPITRFKSFGTEYWLQWRQTLCSLLCWQSGRCFCTVPLGELALIENNGPASWETGVPQLLGFFWSLLLLQLLYYRRSLLEQFCESGLFGQQKGMFRFELTAFFF